MCVTCVELQTLLQKADESFLKKMNEYRLKVTELDNYASLQKAKIAKIRTLLEAQKGLIENPILNQKFQMILSGMCMTSTPATPDYAKFLYYIQKLNKMEHADYVLKYNDRYCNGVLKKIACEYLTMQKKLDNDLADIEQAYRNKTRVLYNQYSELIKKGYANAMAQADQIAQIEAERIINKTRKSVNNV